MLKQTCQDTIKQNLTAPALNNILIKHIKRPLKYRKNVMKNGNIPIPQQGIIDCTVKHVFIYTFLLKKTIKQSPQNKTTTTMHLSHVNNVFCEK